MSRLEKYLLHTSNALVTATGVVYAVMRYIVQPTDEWAVVNHPWQPHVQHLHVLCAPLLVFTVGMIWSRHVIGKLKNGTGGRVSGIGLLVGFAPMAASGYLIQVAVEPGWRTIWIGVHLAASSLWLFALILHQVRQFTADRLADGVVAEPARDEPVS